MSSWRASIAPFAIGLLCAGITVCVTGLLVRDDVTRWSNAGYTVGPEMKFVLVFSGVAGLGGFYVARRLLRGAGFVRREWMLTVPMIAQRATGYREAEAPSIKDLVKRLEDRGYRITAHAVDLEGNLKGDVDLRSSLAGASIWLGDDRLGRQPAGVVVRLSEHVESRTGLAMVESRDVRGVGCEELAMFVIAELDVLVTGVTYRSSDSALTSDAAELRAALPETPQALG